MCMCLPHVCVLSVAISDSVSCVVCGTEALFTVHNARVYVFVVLFCCVVLLWHVYLCLL